MERVCCEYEVIKADRERLARRTALKEARARKVFMLRCMVLSAVLVALISIYGILVVNASDELSGKTSKDTSIKYYTSITVETGDTLWELACKYRPDNYSINSYMNDIIKLNSMSSTTLYAGQNIIIYYME